MRNPRPILFKSQISMRARKAGTSVVRHMRRYLVAPHKCESAEQQQRGEVAVGPKMRRAPQGHAEHHGLRRLIRSQDVGKAPARNRQNTGAMMKFEM